MKRFIVGELESNAYLFWNENKEAVMFDCGGTNLNAIFDFLKENKLILKALILTHGHIDHIFGINLLNEKYPEIEIYIGKEEIDFLSKSEYNLSTHIYRNEFKINKINNLKLISEDDEIFGFKVLDTPGHTIGGKSYYNSENKVLVTGDTMFKNGGVGRTDFPTGDFDMLMKSIKKLCDLPEDTIVYSGHGYESTISLEKKAHRIF